jgi:aspartyl-tRNA(Asn)/glutamyl-tRNA(Gln) amidotransferase subunit A
VFASVDILVAPSTYVLPVTIEQSSREQEAEWSRPGATTPRPPKVPTQAFNIFGLPALSIPCGLTRSGLPIGLQIIGAHFREETVFQLAHAYEQATEWHKHRPAF